MNVSYSQVSAFRQCPASHYWGYVRRIKPIAPIKALHFGTTFHSLLEHRADKAKIKEIIKETAETADTYRNEFGDDYMENLKNIWSDYRRQYPDDPVPDTKEQRFEILMGRYKGEPIYFVGVIDETRRPEGEGKTIVDHKTFSRAPTRMSLVMNLQSGLYAKAEELMTGTLPEWMLWNHVKSTAAVFPVWLEKSQRFSGAKTNKTTEWSYLRACKAHGMEPDPLLLEQYRENNTEFFFRTPVEINPHHVNRCYDDFKDTVKHIVSGGINCRAQHFSRDCSWCKFKDLCYAQIIGADVEDIIKTDFIEKENNHGGQDQEDSDHSHDT